MTATNIEGAKSKFDWLEGLDLSLLPLVEPDNYAMVNIMRLRRNPIHPAATRRVWLVGDYAHSMMLSHQCWASVLDPAHTHDYKRYGQVGNALGTDILSAHPHEVYGMTTGAVLLLDVMTSTDGKDIVLGTHFFSTSGVSVSTNPNVKMIAGESV